MVVFTVAWLNLTGVSAWWKETAQKTCIHAFSRLVAESPWTSIKQNQTVTTHNANQHCRIRFYTFVGQPLSKQLYTVAKLLVDYKWDQAFQAEAQTKNFSLFLGKIPVINI